MHTIPEHKASNDLNTAVLAELVTDYQEDVLNLRASKGDKQACLRVRELVQCGAIREAVEALRASCPSVLKDQRLVFRLKKQEFIEMLRKGSKEGDRKALECVRSELAPLALHAYPEAYLEFKRLLLLLVFDEPRAAQRAQLAGEWAVAMRSELSEIVYHTMRRALGWCDPPLALVLRYLLHVAAMYQSTVAGAAPLAMPEAKVAAQLLAVGRDAGPLWSEAPARSFPEADVQNLILGLGLPRREAVDALKRSGGSLQAAFEDELMRLRLDYSRCTQLTEEYMMARGLPWCMDVTGEVVRPGAAEDGTCFSGEGMDMDEDGGGPTGACAHHEVGEHSGDAAAVQHTGGGVAGPTCPWPPHASDGKRGTDTLAGPRLGPNDGRDSDARAGTREEEEQRPDSRHRDGRGAGPGAGSGTRLRPDSRSPPYKVPRWRGRESASGQRLEAGPLPAGGAPGPEAATHGAMPPTPSQSVAMLSTQEHALRQVHMMARAGMWDKALEAAEALSPGLLARAPALAFNVRRCQFYGHLRAGQYGAALQLARVHLTPYADAEPSLLPVLKSTMAALLPGAQAASKAAPDGNAVAAELADALQEALGLEGPALPRLLSALLAVHRTWCRAQHFSDPFISLLRVDALRATVAARLQLLPQASGEGGSTAWQGMADARGGVGARANRSGSGVVLAAGAALGHGGAAPGDEAPSEGGGPGALEAGGVEDDEEDKEEEVPEDAVLRVMEVLELPRRIAIELLQQHRGSVEEVVTQMLS